MYSSFRVLTFVRFQINLKQTWIFVMQEMKTKIKSTTLKWFFYRTQYALIFQNESAATSSATLVRAMHAMKVYCQNVLARKSVFSCTAFILKFEILQQQVKANSTQLASL